MKKQKISVLLPTYNRVDFLKVAIRSILAQTYKNLELIIYDDGSTDSTAPVIKKFGDKRIKYIKSDKNLGVAHARNRMLEACNTEIACWQDSDDMSNAHRLAIQYEVMKSGNYHIVVSRFLDLNDDSHDSWKKPPRQVTGKMAHASAMFKMEGVLKTKLTKSVGGSDADWLRRMRAKHDSFHCLSEALYYVRWHKNRIGIWKRNPEVNPDWYKRMRQYAKSKKK